MLFDHAAQQVSNVDEAMRWWQNFVKGSRVLYADETWGLLEAGGVRLAFVVADEHPNHLAWRVSEDELERLAQEHKGEIAVHRDGSRSFYLDTPGGQAIELIAYADEEGENVE